MSYDFELSCELPETPEVIYSDWLSSEGHSDMTGGKAEASDVVGAAYSAWDGYIQGRNVELTPFSRIVQTWRTTQFPEGHPDSTITIDLAPSETGTRLTLTHRGVPDGQTTYEESGWREFYFEPMQAYFSDREDD
jgi:activator of HSP90 ATPase